MAALSNFQVGIPPVAPNVPGLEQNTWQVISDLYTTFFSLIQQLNANLVANIGIDALGNVTLLTGGTLKVVNDAYGIRVEAVTTGGFPGLRIENTVGARVGELIFLGPTGGPAYGAAAGSLVMNSSASAAGLCLSTSDAAGLKIDNAQLVHLQNTTLLKTDVSLTNNAAAALGTLVNAPVAGPPTKWIPINDNGTIRNIPCW